MVSPSAPPPAYTPPSSRDTSSSAPPAYTPASPLTPSAPSAASSTSAAARTSMLSPGEGALSRRREALAETAAVVDRMASSIAVTMEALRVSPAEATAEDGASVQAARSAVAAHFDGLVQALRRRQAEICGMVEAEAERRRARLTQQQTAIADTAASLRTCLETIDRALEADAAGAPALAQAGALAETLELNTTVVASSDITVILPPAPLGDVAAIGTVLQEEARQPVPYCIVAKRWLWDVAAPGSKRNGGDRFDITLNRLSAHKARDNGRCGQIVATPAATIVDAAWQGDLEVQMRLDIMGLSDDRDRIGLVDDNSRHSIAHNGFALNPRTGAVHVSGRAVGTLPGPTLHAGSCVVFIFEPQRDLASVRQPGHVALETPWRGRTGTRVWPAVEFRRVGWRASLIIRG